MPLRHGLALVVILASAAACSSADPEAASGSGGGGNGSDGTVATNASWIVGRWTGRLKTNEADSEFPKGTSVSATFAADPKDKSPTPGGVFEITFDQLPETKSKGTFLAVGATSQVMLKVNESSLSLIGQGQSPTYALSIVGPGMTLKNDQMTFDMARTTPVVDKPTEPTDPGKINNELVGHWHCNDTVGRPWYLYVKNDTSFDMEIRASGQPTVLMSGSVAVITDDATRDAVLTVKSTNLPVTNGMELNMKLGAAPEMKLTVKDQPSLSCARDT